MIEVGQQWTHRRNGSKYQTMALGQMKSNHGGAWAPSVTYFSLKEKVADRSIYTRKVTDFLVSFYIAAEVATA